MDDDATPLTRKEDVHKAVFDVLSLRNKLIRFETDIGEQTQVAPSRLRGVARELHEMSDSLQKIGERLIGIRDTWPLAPGEGLDINRLLNDKPDADVPNENA